MGYYIRKAIPSLNQIIFMPVAISLFCHAVLISATSLIDMRPDRKKEPQAFTVQLPDAGIGQKKAGPKSEAKARNMAPRLPGKTRKANPAQEKEVKGETLSIDREDVKYADYLARIRQAIEDIWSYPRKAMEKGREGDSTVRFSLDRSGALLALRIVKSSGDSVLDDESLRVIRTSAPFTPFPGTMDIAKLHIVATFHYRLTE